MTILKILIYSSLCYLPALSLQRSLIVTTTGGLVKGKVNEFNGIKYYSYEGIPYAENPTRKLRFKPPVPKRPWAGVLDATKTGTVCSQLKWKYNPEDTSEDCLNVNVFVPANGRHKLLPVMVFVHGGGLQYLSGNIDDGPGPQFLLGEKMIFVTMNHRLGPFGFLSLGIEEASGNAGLKDVLLSLTWVKRNIKNFGGNTDKITIAGLSSGSLIINYLLLTNQSNDLFNHAMLLSGSAFTPRSYTKHPKDIAFALAKELNIETHDVYKTLNALQEIDALAILDAYKNMSRNYNSPLRLYAPFMPTKEIKYDQALFIDDPIELFRKTDKIPINVPAVVGIAAQEAISNIPFIFHHVDGVNKLRDNHENLIPSNIEYPIGSQRSKNLGRLISDTYFGGEDMNNLTLTSLIEFISDTQYIYGVNYWIKKYKNMIGSNALYFYIFDFVGDLNRSTFYKFNITGSGHGDDVNYFLVTPITKSVMEDIDKRNQQMMDRMVRLVSNFVYYGNPAPKGLKTELKWLDYGNEQNYLLLNDNPVVEKFCSSPLYARMQFWEKVYDEYYQYVDKGGKIQKKIIP